MPDKNDSKNPLQDQVKKDQEQILKGTETVSRETKPAKKRRGRPPKKKIEPEIFDEQKSAAQAMAVFTFINDAKKNNGLPEFNQHVQIGFVNGAVELERKYGSAVSKWTPEILFGGAVAAMVFTTLKEVKVLREAKIKAKKSPEKSPEKSGKADDKDKQKNEIVKSAKKTDSKKQTATLKL